MNNLFFLLRAHPLVTFLASGLIWFLLFSLLAVYFYSKKKDYVLIIQAFIAFLISWVFSEILKSFFPWDRPFEISGAQPLTISIPGSNAFPSSHSATAFALAWSLFLSKPKLGKYYVAGAIFVALGRVLAHVHYVGDVLGGAGVGILSAYIVRRIFAK